MALGKQLLSSALHGPLRSKAHHSTGRVGLFAFEPTLFDDNSLGFTEDDGTFHDVLQFTNIPGPMVVLHLLQRVLVEMTDVFATPLANRPTT